MDVGAPWQGIAQLTGRTLEVTMAGPKDKYPSYTSIISRILAEAQGPVSAKELAVQMLALHPSTAKNPLRAMLTHIREENGRLLVYLDPDTVLPLRLAYEGARFRFRLNKKAMNAGLINLSDAFRTYLPLPFLRSTPVSVQFIDLAGSPISFEKKLVSTPIQTIFGKDAITSEHANLSGWFRAQKVRSQDHLLFTILDWENGVFQLEHEPASQRNEKLLRERNQLLADLFFHLLENKTYESLYPHIAVPTVYAHLPDKSGYPPDQWMVVLELDGRMTANGIDIRYADSGPSPFDRLLQDISGQTISQSTKPISYEQSRQVYRFKAELAYQPKIWRTIEIQGKQTLAALDQALREAFNHDTYDHLGGSWKLVPRGGKENPLPLRQKSWKQIRYREIDLGDVNPLGGGDGARSKIGSLELSVGDKLKYVYDFGDWIEHTLTLEAIGAADKEIQYPREVERNQPEFVNCALCQKKGKQTVAKWICLNCSTGPEDDMVLCEKCVEKHDEDHNIEENLY
jgi:hypothetical protein